MRPASMRPREGRRLGATGSATSSEREASQDPPRKRKRASKPKVRTGCITCKIRRVKCDETKPACHRCTSTGRACDGYDSEATATRRPSQNQLSYPPRLPSGAGSSQTPLPSPSLLTSSSTPTPPPYWHAAAAEAAASTPGLRIIRPSPPDIEGTEIERSYFHEFRRAAEEGMAQNALNDAAFWKWTIPHLCLHEPAIRHAVVALGAALRTYRLAEPRTPGAPASETEVFTLDKYGQAMTVLGKMSREAPGVTATTLVCCLAFVTIECLLGNWEEALQHLRSGLAIIDSAIPIEDLMALADPHGLLPGTGQLASDTDYVVRTFSMLESSACLYKEDFRPTISLKLLNARRAAGLAPTDPQEPFDSPHDVASAHRAALQFMRDACALSWEWNFEPKGDVARQCEELLSVGQKLEWGLRRFSGSPNAPRPGTMAEVSMRIEMLHVAACKQLAWVTASRSTGQPGMEAGFQEVVRLVGDFKRSLAALGSEAHERRFIIDMGIISSVYLVVYRCSDERIRERALAHLRGWQRREHFWDGPEMMMLLEAGEEGVELPRSVSGTAAIPALREKLGGLRIEEERGGEGEGSYRKDKGKGKGKGKGPGSDGYM